VTSAPRPIAADRVADEVAAIVDRAAAACPHVLRVAVDGHPAAGPDALADALVDPLRLVGRPVLRVGSGWFLRPASVRLERGQTDPDAFYDDRLDVAALRREVLDPLGPGGSGAYLPSLWDPSTDRATRSSYVPAPPNAVLIVDGRCCSGTACRSTSPCTCGCRPVRGSGGARSRPGGRCRRTRGTRPRSTPRIEPTW